jgi:hypothetical protein
MSCGIDTLYHVAVGNLSYPTYVKLGSNNVFRWLDRGKFVKFSGSNASGIPTLSYAIAPSHPPPHQARNLKIDLLSVVRLQTLRNLTDNPTQDRPSH